MRYTFLWLLLLSMGTKAQQSFIQIGDSLYQLGNYRKAISSYEKVNSAKAAFKIARSYNAIGNHDKSIDAYQQAIEKDSNLVIAKYELAKLFVKKRRNQEARPIFENLMDNDSLNPNYSYYLGLLTKEDSLSIIHFKRSYQLDATHLKSIYRISRHFLVNEDRDSLFHYSNIGLKEDPNNVDLINLQSQYLFNRGWHEQVQPMLEKLMTLGQRSETIRKRLAITYFKNDLLEKSLELFLELIDDNPKEAGYHTYVGTIYRKMQKYEEAIPYFETALNIKNPSIKSDYLTLALIHIDLGDEVKATQFMDKAFREKPYNMFSDFSSVRIIENRFKDPSVKLNFFLKFKKRYPEAPERIGEWVKSKITDLKGQIHMGKG
ncbi:tetratricopeptide repeat protein [Spongiivirga sp. MCCC 1A20706]|uniref:tetratricopeptide repeat protein n=1 Tax=Spongiivirga sp. MCCC 1A20706 TaxID=3160963 RepID=UPI003977C2C2